MLNSTDREGINCNDFHNIVRQQILVGEFEHFKDELYNCIGQPSLFISKFDPSSDKYYGLVSPVLNFSIIPKYPEYEGLSLTEYADLIDKDNYFGYSMLKKFRVINKGDLFKSNGVNHVLYETEYLFEHEEMDGGIMVEMSILNIDYGDFFLDFSMTGCKTQGNTVSVELENILESITLEYK